MKSILVYFILIFGTYKSFGQDSLSAKNMADDIDVFYKDSFSIKDYKDLPDYIRNYLDQKIGGEFRLATKRFRKTDTGSPRLLSRKLMYIGGSSTIYILGYEHGGNAYHDHTLIFKVNGKEVIYVYNMLTGQPHALSELKKYLENGWYSIASERDF